MNITLLGPGAIGSLWAYHLCQSGHQVTLWGRGASGSNTFHLDQKPDITLAYNQLESLAKADLVLVTVKAWQVEAALEPLIGHLHPDTMIVLMHNGMGTATWLADKLGNNPLLLATTTHGALRASEREIRHTGQGITHIGGINHAGKQCHFLKDVLAHSLPSVAWCDDIQAALWNKLAINCAINPITAKYAITNGELAKPEYHQELLEVVREVHQVMIAEGVSIQLTELQAKVDDVVRLTAKNYSSMQQDIEHGRRSEINYITGYLLRRASAHQLELPYNQALYEHIQQMEKENLSHE